eukprot:g15252.t1
MAGGGRGKGHKQATPEQIAELRELLSGLEATNANVLRYRWLTDDRMLHRFITARNGNVEVALKMLLEHLDWRVSYKLDGILDEDLSGAGVSHEFYWSGFDREGRPCLVFRACEHKKSDPDRSGPTVEEKVRYYCQLLERGFRDFAPAHKFCLILDCRGAGTNVMDRKLFKVATPIIENNFPETQHATYVLPCNGIITMAWKVISSFIDPGTADKIRLVKDFDDQALVEAFTPETLKAFVSLNPSLAPPQPYVAPDPLANPPPPSKSSASALSNGVRSGHNNGHHSQPSSGVHPSDASSTRLPPQHPRPSAATLAAAAAVAAAGGGGDDDDSSVLLPPPSPGGSTLVGVNAGPSPSGSQMPSLAGRTEDGTVQPKLSPAGAAAAVQHRAGVAARAEAEAAGAAAGAGGAAAPPSPSGSASMGQHQAAPPSPAGDSLYASTAGGTEGGADGGGGGPKENVFDERFIAKSTASGGADGAGGGGGSNGFGANPPPPAVVARASEETGGARPPPPASAVAAAIGAPLGGLGEGVAQPAASKTVEFAERTGVLYKRRDTLRGRFAYRQKYAVLRFPPAEAASLASRRRASGAGMASTSPTPPPTLSLQKGRGQARSEKVVSLEGAEVTLGTAMAGKLYPFVISFSGPQRAGTGPARQEPKQPHEEQGPPPRRNTEDFVFTGVLDPSGSSSIAGSDAAAGGGDGGGISGGDYMHQPALNDAAVGGRGGRVSMPPPLPPGMRSASSSRLPSPYLQRTMSSASSSSMMTGGGGRKRSDSLGSSASGMSRQRKTLHLGCETEEKTLQWARWLADAIALHEAATEAAAAAAAEDTGQAPWEQAGGRMLAAGVVAGARGAAAPSGHAVGARGASATATNGERAPGGAGAGAGSRLLPPYKNTGFGLEHEDDAELSYRAKYAEALDALAAASGSLPNRAGRATAGDDEGLAGSGAGIVRTRDGSGVGGGVGRGAGGEAPTGMKLRYILEKHRRRNPNGGIGEAAAFSPGKAPPLPPRKNSLRSTFSKRKGSSRSFLGKTKDGSPLKATATSFSSSSSAAAEAVLKGLGEAGGALMSMRDSEISRLRRAYARSELSREEMKRCLRALAVQLREGEDRTGALLADREAVLYDIGAKEAEFAKKEALLEEDKARVAAEVQQKAELVSSLQVENKALQAAVERLRHDFQEERALRLQREKKAGGGTSAPGGAPPTTPSRLGIMGRRSLKSRHSLPPDVSRTPSRHSGVLSGPGVHNHNARSTPHRVPGRARPSGGVGAEAAAVAAAAAASAAGWESNHGGIGSRHSVPTMLEVESGVATEEGEPLPWVLNTDQTWEGAARPPQEVLAHLLDELDGIMAAAAGADAADSSDDATTPLVTPPDESNGGGLARDAAEGGGSRKIERARRGGGGKGFVAETEAFIQWSHRTGELQKVPPLESVDLPGEKRFTEGCLKLLSAHAAAVLHKEPGKLTTREEARMAYAIGDDWVNVLCSFARCVRREACSGVIHQEVSHFILPRLPQSISAVQPGPIQPQQVGPAPAGDLRLAEFMEQVKHELWEFNAMPLRKRFRVQSLLRRLHTPPLESWSNALARATEECPRPFTRTLLARHEPASSLLSVPEHLHVEAPGFELLLLCWRPGAASAIHDHPKAGCWVKVLKGEIRETRYSLAPNGSSSSSSSGGELPEGGGGGNEGGGRLVKTSTVTCNPGTVSYIEDSMGLHKMENPSPTEECISLHLYSPGISECSTWADASTCASNSVKVSMCLDDNFVQKRRLGLQQ